MIQPDELRRWIDELSESHCCLIAALVCDKLYPNYLLFTETDKWGSPALFRAGIELLFEASVVGIRPISEAQKLDDELDSAFPDLDDFTSSEASYAFDASSALNSAFQFLITGDKEHVVSCSISAFDTVDMFVQMLHEIEPNVPDLDQLIYSDPYMQREVERQQRLLTLLSKTPIVSADFIAQLRQEQESQPAIVDVNKLPAE
ncbi:DUF416 family protein [Hymenobacter sp. IS2118]|uniref:DUF416 family protein n=1 Tax=Hymenobacter sp. IS2118 TaxID=1505605 RepID=UPI0009070159|nr:DUF416 family protein [Hymenobacter sp. IS2118]